MNDSAFAWLFILEIMTFLLLLIWTGIKIFGHDSTFHMFVSFNASIGR